MRSRKPPELKVSLAGPGINPDTVDTLQLLGLAEAYFSLLAKTAEATGNQLTFRGIRMHKGSAVLATVPNNMPVALTCTKKTLRVLKGQEGAPVGTAELANRVGKMVRAFPHTQTPKVVAGSFRKIIEAPAEVSSEGAWEMCQFRAKPIRVGGQDPQAWFFAVGETAPFPLRVSEHEARKLGALLYLPVDIDAEVCRDPAGRIERGNLVRFDPLNDTSPLDAWREWYRENAASWDEVADIEGELRAVH